MTRRVLVPLGVLGAIVAVAWLSAVPIVAQSQKPSTASDSCGNRCTSEANGTVDAAPHVVG